MVTIPEQEYEKPGSHQICKKNEKDTDRAGRWSKIHGLLPFPNGFSSPLVPLPKDGSHDTSLKPFSSSFFSSFMRETSWLKDKELSRKNLRRNGSLFVFSNEGQPLPWVSGAEEFAFGKEEKFWRCSLVRQRGMIGDL